MSTERPKILEVLFLDIIENVIVFENSRAAAREFISEINVSHLPFVEDFETVKTYGADICRLACQPT